MLVVKAGADPRNIRMKIGGARRLSLDDSGALVIADPQGELRIELPKIYQRMEGANCNGSPGIMRCAERTRWGLRWTSTTGRGRW